MTTTTKIAAAIASGLALTPAHATAPRVHRPPVPHTQPASAPASQPAPRPHVGASPMPLEQLAYRITHVGAFDGLIAKAALEQGLDPHLLRALLYEESKLDPWAVNPVTGAAGMGQHTATGRAGVNELRCLKRSRRLRCSLGAHEYTREKALQPEESIQATAEHLAALVSRWGVFGGVRNYNGGAHRRTFALRVLRTANRYRVESGLPPLREPRTRPARQATS
jgi:hypothetical protein